MNKKIIALIKDIQDECIIFDGNCIGDKNSKGCTRVNVCMNVFGNNFRPCEHGIEDLYKLVLKG